LLDGWGGCSFLLFVNARSFQQIGRTVAPHAIPFGFQAFSLLSRRLRHTNDRNRRTSSPENRPDERRQFTLSATQPSRRNGSSGPILLKKGVADAV
jgi:hypothetical protein